MLLSIAVEKEEASQDYHPLLGVVFKAFLQARDFHQRVRIAVTRPSGHSVGRGELRIVRVRETDGELDLLFAYEGYFNARKSSS